MTFLSFSVSLTEAAKWIMLANPADIGKIRYICVGCWIKIFADNMDYISIAEFAKKNGVSERTVRNWCASGKMEGAFKTGMGGLGD